MIVTIDGPAGAGKSSIAREVARTLQFAFLDTGAMYRCVTYAALQAEISFTNQHELLAVAQECQIDFQNDQIILNEVPVDDRIRTPEVTRHIRYAADHPEIRAFLNGQQRRIAANQDIVTEGRDQGTEVFPHAECKVFLTASPEERAKRRWQQLQTAGGSTTVEEILAAQNQRDLEDETRKVGRLRPADDATILNTDGLSPTEVLERILQIVAAC
ncbi:Cytidylate kinase [Roseimaritima multifibrata]|uniref:Cytidylate kinase n=1 Tax=Roseimaritima multifibrata TaxID=1930274 RepID=A0A517MKC9_9BACT|nr:(d)CMP kinase [Roseimaritima multifibrata]QDS95300.1 Cytidylate kinase [Roseimaritima multifibrata]